MPRRKLSEYQAKKIINQALDMPYVGWQVTGNDNDFNSDESLTYVAKVDQAMKKRFKNGLVLLDATPREVKDWINDIHKKGYDSFIIEQYCSHEQSDERYLCITKDTDAMRFTINSAGGVDVESQADTLREFFIDEQFDWNELAGQSGLTTNQLNKLAEVFEENYMTLLEINPYIITQTGPLLLDIAVEVDDAAMHYVSSWTKDDLRNPPRMLTKSEQQVATLADSSPASFTLQAINPDGSIFLLLSGGGASVVIADEIYSAGFGAELANYGEYSGNPTSEETYVYASALFEMAIDSNAPRKVIVIGGAVANFTDIAKTFSGIIKSIDEYADRFREQDVKIVVRRGGPHQEEGLARIKDVLAKYELLGAVYDPSVSIGGAVKAALEEIKS